jgi:hypothetical protein
MTGSQNEYETDAEPTPGPWQIATSCSYRRIVNDRMSPVCVPTVQSADGHPDLYFPNGGANGPDARLIAAAGTAAQEAKEMGYDPQEAVEELSDILRVLESISSIQKGHRHAGHTAAQTAQSKLDALASAEGSGDE